MGKNKQKGPKLNVFKVAGAKSLKKTKAKAVNLGLKNIKEKVKVIDEQFLNIKENPKPQNSKNTPKVKNPKKKSVKVTNEEVSNTAKNIDSMEL